MKRSTAKVQVVKNLNLGMIKDVKFVENNTVLLITTYKEMICLYSMKAKRIFFKHQVTRGYIRDVTYDSFNHLMAWTVTTDEIAGFEIFDLRKGRLFEYIHIQPRRKSNEIYTTCLLTMDKKKPVLALTHKKSKLEVYDALKLVQGKKIMLGEYKIGSNVQRMQYLKDSQIMLCKHHKKISVFDFKKKEIIADLPVDVKNLALDSEMIKACHNSLYVFSLNTGLDSFYFVKNKRPFKKPKLSWHKDLPVFPKIMKENIRTAVYTINPRNNRLYVVFNTDRGQMFYDWDYRNNFLTRDAQLSHYLKYKSIHLLKFSDDYTKMLIVNNDELSILKFRR